MGEELREAIAAFNGACARLTLLGGTREQPTPERPALEEAARIAIGRVIVLWGAR